MILPLLAAAALSAQFDFDLTAPTHWDGLGMQVFFLDDINGDGVPEFGGGSFCTDLRGHNTGSVYIFDGASQAPIRRHDGYGRQARLGETAMAISDLDGDGFCDYMSGARNETVNGLRRGVVYVWSGLTGDIIHEISGREAEGNFGRGLACVPDLDGDGIDDLAIGAPKERNRQGTVAFFSGATGAKLRQISGPEPKAEFGYSLTAIGDIDLDGIGDLAVGAPYWDKQKGGVLFYSGASGDLIYSRMGQTEGSRFGWKVVDPGDVNLDGRPDVLVGEPCTDSTYLITATTGQTLRAYQGQQTPTKSGLGHEMAAAGDVNGDGYPDYAISHPGEWDFGLFEFYGPGGGVFLLSGADGTVIQHYDPVEDDDSFGSAVAVYTQPNPLGNLILIGAPAWGDLFGGYAPGMVSGRTIP